jgi:hypothetical protein
LATTEITNPPEDCPNKSIIFAGGLSVKVSKAALLEE